MEPATTQGNAELRSGQLAAHRLGSTDFEVPKMAAPVKVRLVGSDEQPFLLKGSPQAPALKASAVETPDLQASSLQVGEATSPSRSIRLFDLSLASLILLAVLPLMAICALVVAFSSPGPLLFRQARIGRGGKKFICLKFRTMTDRADKQIGDVLDGSSSSQEEWAATFKLRSDPRVTPAGRILRRYCLDELPQLFNVLKGEMSLVGPRPIVDAEVERYGRHFADYCKVNPGLTGLWQVSGAHDLSYEERVLIDSAYANSKSLGLDMKILVKTVPIVVFGTNC